MLGRKTIRTESILLRSDYDTPSHILIDVIKHCAYQGLQLMMAMISAGVKWINTPSSLNPELTRRRIYYDSQFSTPVASYIFLDYSDSSITFATFKCIPTVSEVHSQTSSCVLKIMQPCKPTCIPPQTKFMAMPLDISSHSSQWQQYSVDSVNKRLPSIFDWRWMKDVRHQSKELLADHKLSNKYLSWTSLALFINVTRPSYWFCCWYSLDSNIMKRAHSARQSRSPTHTNTHI